MRSSLLVLAGVLPFFTPYIWHLVNAEGTGFVDYDCAYYCACGREVFERGNGLGYPNPYDTNPDSPIIYYHWFIWLLGFTITQLRLDPGIVFGVIGVVAAGIASWLTLQLVRTVARGRYVELLFLVVMWGGGLLWVGRIVENVWFQREWFDQMWFRDPCAGKWCLNWGRNLIYAQESVYHALVAASWLATLRNRHWLALLATVALATTHPWSGLQLLGINLTWSMLKVVFCPSKTSLLFFLLYFFVALIFAGYYGYFLKLFPAHNQIQQTWSLDWRLKWPSVFLAYGPVVLLAARRLVRDVGTLGRQEGFLLCCAAVSLGLALHDRFVSPVQPLHFTRGYVWLPICLIALPLVESLLESLSQHRPMLFRVGISVVAIIVVSDNALFLLCKYRAMPGETLDTDGRQLFAYINAEELQGIVACKDANLAYLSATYTGMRPYVGHEFLTPNIEIRRDRFQRWLESPNRVVNEEFEYVVVDACDASQFDRRRWRTVHRMGKLVLLRNQLHLRDEFAKLN